jgi:tetratricopeptide (TPR) repeat protein
MRALALACLVIVAAMWLRVASDASRELRGAQAAQAAGQLDQAIERYQYAMRGYTPLSSVPQRAALALQAIARAAVARHDRATALDALQRLRGAALATRGVLAPFDGWLPSTNRTLARLLAAEQIAQGAAPEQRATLTAARLRELEHTLDAPRGWSLLIVLAYAGWLGGAALTVLRGLDRDARVIPRAALRWSAWTALCFGLWLLGLWRA